MWKGTNYAILQSYAGQKFRRGTRYKKEKFDGRQKKKKKKPKQGEKEKDRDGIMKTPNPLPTTNDNTSYTPRYVPLTIRFTLGTFFQLPLSSVSTSPSPFSSSANGSASFSSCVLTANPLPRPRLSCPLSSHLASVLPGLASPSVMKRARILPAGCPGESVTSPSRQ